MDLHPRRVLTEFRDGKLRVEYFGKKDPRLDAQIEAAVGQRFEYGWLVAEGGRFAEQRQQYVFQVAPEKIRAVRDRLQSLQAIA